MFNKLKSKENLVNFHEAFVSITIFADGEFDHKLLGLFRSFDVDAGGSIDRQEMIAFLMAAVFGLCKLLSIPLVDKNEIITYAKAIFAEVDEDDSGEISFEEFQGWIKNSSDLQLFLLKYTGMQSIEESIKTF